MLRHRRFSIWFAVIVASLSITLIGVPRMATASPAAGAATTGTGPDPSRLTSPDQVLPPGWRISGDRVVTVIGDRDALRVLDADEAAGYQWRTAASLSEPGFDTDGWIGQDCVTASGRYAAVVYAPREYTNYSDAYSEGAFAAIVDLSSGAVRKLAVRASLAYYDPGCGADDRVAISSLATSGDATRSSVTLIDARTGAALRTTTSIGQLSSAVPFAGGVAAVSGDRLVSVDAQGALGTLATLTGVPFRLHPDAQGGLAFEVPRDNKVQVQRYVSGRATVLGAGDLDAIRVDGSAGRVFVLGPQSSKIHSPSSWTRLPVGVDAQPSTTGAMAVTGVSNHSAAAGATNAPGSGPSGLPPNSVHLNATLTATGKSASFSVEPGAAQPAQGSTPSPASRKGSRNAGGVRADDDSGTVPWDPDRGCAMPRNDPTQQVFQATAQQVEWAADLAVHGALTVSRPKNWKGSGMPVSWSPQGLFPMHLLSGGGTVPAQVLLGILAQESNTMQASPHAVDGITGNFNQGGFYGDGIDWSTVDCGYGVGQVTTGMAVADGHTVYTANQQLAIATDYASNIAASLNLLIDKWNQLRAAGIVANSGSANYVQDWWFAAWAYNTGIQPSGPDFGNTTGCTPGPSCTDSDGYWGLGWSNNPANPDYPVDRHPFNTDPNDPITPNLWPYEELVMGWAQHPVARYDYTEDAWEPAYAPENLPYGTATLPGHNAFCSSADHCAPNGATDLNNKPGAGLCQLDNLHCWWHQPVSWATCSDSCGLETLHYEAGDPEPAAPDPYPADCSMAGMPTGTVIVDDVTTTSVAPCTKGWTDAGKFSLSFPEGINAGCRSTCILYPGKIDFHQLGTGFGGHLWFTHTAYNPSVTGTWTPPADSTGWTRIKVHIPASGGTTQQADYVIDLGNGQTRHRIVNQNWSQDVWIDLGTFDLAAGAKVSLSNASPHVASEHVDFGDIAYDAVAFIPSSKPLTDYVAIGDSYSSGESNIPFEPESDVNGVDECHRSLTQAYPNSVRLPGQSQTVSAQEAANQADFHFIACSGAQSIDLTQASVDPDNTDNTEWGVAENYHYGEVNQIDDSGWLDQDTTLVTVSIGGNDVGFGDIVRGCLEALVTTCIDDSYRLSRTFGDFPGQQTSRKDTQALTAYEPTLIAHLRSHLVNVYDQIHLYAPNARILVVGYPHLFESGATEGCEGFTPGVQTWMNQMADKVTQTISGAVSDVRAAYPSTNISFMDPTSAFVGHEVCEVPGIVQWLNGIDLLNQISSMHPNHNGQAAYATLVNAALASS